MQMTLGTWRFSVERTTPTDAELAGMYDEAAGRWQKSLDLFGLPRAYDDLFAQLNAAGLLSTIKYGARVLDCGIGTAAFSVALAGAVTAPVGIEGVDISEQMLNQARRNLDGAELGSARLHTADMRNLPFEDGAFDAVISAHVLEHLPNPFTGLSEMARVLRPGGVAIGAVTRGGPPDALLRLRWRYQSLDRRLLARWMEEAGLADVRAYPLGDGSLLAHRTSIAFVGFKKRL